MVGLLFVFSQPKTSPYRDVAEGSVAVPTPTALGVIWVFVNVATPLPSKFARAHAFDVLDAIAEQKLRHSEFAVLGIGVCCPVCPLVVCSFLFPLTCGNVEDMVFFSSRPFAWQYFVINHTCLGLRTGAASP